GHTHKEGRERGEQGAVGTHTRRRMNTVTRCPKWDGREDGDTLQASVVTDRTALDVEAGEAEHEVTHGLGAGGRQRGLRQERAALREGRAPSAVGEQAEMADANEAVGNNVEQEAAEELVGLQLHELHAMAISVVTPPEADPPTGERDEAVVGQRH